MPDWTNLEGYFAAFARNRSAINLGTFISAGGVRDHVIGRADRPATADELRTMEAQVAEAMEMGALGVSTSLQYVPDRFASTDELIALARVAGRYGGSYITHQRWKPIKSIRVSTRCFALLARPRSLRRSII